MKIKERIIFKDMTLASAIAAAICLISSYALLPLIFRIIDKSIPLEIHLYYSLLCSLSHLFALEHSQCNTLGLLCYLDAQELKLSGKQY